jgi:muconolactone D-isomerase
MLFHVTMKVRPPYDLDPDLLGKLTTREHERAGQLARQRKWIHAWRVAGNWANVSVFDVESPAELHEILSSLPLYPFMEVEVTALCTLAGFPEIESSLGTA